MPVTHFVIVCQMSVPGDEASENSQARQLNVSSLQFEESLISHKMAQMGDESEDETPDNEEDDGKNFLLSDDGKDIDLRSAFVGFLCITCMLVCPEVQAAKHHAAVLAWAMLRSCYTEILQSFLAESSA